MVETVQVIGAGRVGSAIAARLAQRGVELREDGAELVLFCVPDTAIADTAARIAPGPWVAHVSGATPLAALAPHVRRFGLHPLQTFTQARGPEQLDGAWAAVTAETAEARELGFEQEGLAIARSAIRSTEARLFGLLRHYSTHPRRPPA